MLRLPDFEAPPRPAYRIKFPRQPLLCAALAYSTGIVAGAYLWRPEFWWLAASLFFIFAAAFSLKRRTWLALSLAFGALFLAGALHIQIRDASTATGPAAAPLDGEELEITAHIIRVGPLTHGNFGEMRQVLDVETESLTAASGISFPTRLGLRLGVYSSQNRETENAGTNFVPGADSSSNIRSNRAFQYGQRIRFPSKLKAPRNFRNPGAFDYESYLYDKGIVALASTKSENIEFLSGFSGNRLELWRSRIRQHLIAQIHHLWPPQDAAVIDAMVIGEEAFIDRDTRMDFQRSGTYHVLIVSGMNVSILAFVVFWTLRRIRLGHIPATLLTVSFCFAYALLTEVGAPVWRATLMCAVYLGSRLVYRERAMVNAIGAAAVVVLLFDPRQLFTASFQMTFLCVLIVAAIGLPVLDRTSQLYRRALAHWNSRNYALKLFPGVAQFRLDLLLISGRIAGFIGKKWAGRVVRGIAAISFSLFELLFISAAMQIGLALPMAYYFHRAATIGMPANLAVVPLTELLMPSAVLALALSTVSLVLARIPALTTTLALHGIVGTVHGLGGLRLADLRVPTPSTLIIALAITSLALAMLLVRRRLVLSAAGLFILLAVAVAIALSPARADFHYGLLEVTSIDVGQGDSTLLVMPRGATLLIDAGGPIGGANSQLDFGEDVVSPYLWSRGISRLDAVAITHGHSDHIGGIPAVLKNFRPRELWIGLKPPSAALDKIIDEAEALHIKIVRHWEGDEFDWGGAQVSVLFPPADRIPGAKPENNDSLVLKVAYQVTSVLLEGDAQRQVEQRIALLHHPVADLLRVGHHGSANATTPDLLDSARPHFAVISVGFRNSFGLPKFQTLERLAQSGAHVYRTDLDGAVTFYLDGRSVAPSLPALH